jgi:hypothetical protein
LFAQVAFIFHTCTYLTLIRLILLLILSLSHCLPPVQQLQVNFILCVHEITYVFMCIFSF